MRYVLHFRQRPGRMDWLASLLCRTVVVMTVLGPMPALAAASDLASMCETAAAVAAQETGVPVSVLKAIALTETGRRQSDAVRPWPWTVNMEGQGVWFQTEDEARAYVYDHFKAGARSFDLGCFQINYRWHGSAFNSIEEMFDPSANALYAARFLKGLYDELGDWSVAAGAYHSRTPEFAQRYIKRFEGYREAFSDSDISAPKVVADAHDEAVPRREAKADGWAVSRQNQYPLLRGGGLGQMGSLVSFTSGEARRRLIGLTVPQG